MTAEEYEIFLRKVEESGKTQNSFLLNLIAGAEILNTDGLKSIIPDLKRIGNNLNQIAKSCNSGYPVELVEIKKINSDLGEVWQSLRRFLQRRVSGGRSAT